MKKSSLTTAIIAGVAGVAGLVNVSNAVSLNADGLGDVLVYPYYTVNGDNDTLISVVNTTNKVKAVKVRFVESLNSREVLDFNLYLSPYDVWTGAVTEYGQASGGEVPGMIRTDDKSCTVPAIKPEGEPFVNYAYTGKNNDAGPDGLARTRQGHIELIEMGIVEDPALAAAATHTSAGVPSKCSALVNAWFTSTGQWRIDRNDGVTSGVTDTSNDRGGLFGSAIIVDTEVGSSFSYNADAIEGFYLATGSTLHFDPGTTSPDLTNGNGGAYSAGLGYGQVANVFNSGAVQSFGFALGDVRAVSTLYMHSNIYNEYIQGNGFATEWVVTFPTKRYHVDEAIVGSTPIPPFTNTFKKIGSNGYGACEEIGFSYWDREEQTTTITFGGFSPPKPEEDGPALCYEAEIVTFTQDLAGGSAILGESSEHARNVDVKFNQGWARINFPRNSMTAPEITSQSERTIFGLPVTGFQVSEYKTSVDAAGKLASFAMVHRHRGDFVVS